MKIYTKTGDEGETGLMGGKRVSKASPKIIATGEIDELNAALGICLAMTPKPELKIILHQIQQDLFSLGADLSTPLESTIKVPRIEALQIEKLEKWIDEIELKLEPLQNFILPGGSLAAAHLHLARTICRRAARAMVAIFAEGRSELGTPCVFEKINSKTLIYINRLSDLLFVLARFANKLENSREEIWRA